MRAGRSGKDGLGLTTYNAGEVKIPRSLENCQVLSISLYFNHIFSFDVLMPTWLLVLKKNLVFSKKTRLILGISSVEFFMIIIPNKPHKDLENIGIIVQNYIAVTDMSFWFFLLIFYVIIFFRMFFTTYYHKE